jgi:CheY-like chemotaxis protein
MGGKVWATSRVARGSSFYARIQVAEVDLDRSATPQRGVSTHKPDLETSKKLGETLPLKIVVAEDNRANQRVMMMLLRRLGWEAEYKENGAELLEHLQENPCDLVFMDLQMPVMDGLEATKQIRLGAASEAMKDVKIIALTANALSTDEARCLEVGMDAYLSKPIKIDLMEQVVSELFA